MIVPRPIPTFSLLSPAESTGPLVTKTTPLITIPPATAGPSFGKKTLPPIVAPKKSKEDGFSYTKCGATPVARQSPGLNHAHAAHKRF